MTDETALIPVTEFPPVVYTTRQRQIIRWLSRPLRSPFMVILRNNMREDLVTAYKAITEGAKLTWQDFQSWRKRLRKAYAYSRTAAKHRRRRFETTVSRSTPVEARTYEPEPTTLRTRIADARRKNPRTVVVRRPADPFTDTDTTWLREHWKHQNNARLIMTGAEGPLAP